MRVGERVKKNISQKLHAKVKRTWWDSCTAEVCDDMSKSLRGYGIKSFLWDVQRMVLNFGVDFCGGWTGAIDRAKKRAEQRKVGL